ncbi:unnamed protein product [Discula destructiva]
MSSRNASLLYRSILLLVLLFILVASIQYFDLLQGQRGFTDTLASNNNRLLQQGVPQPPLDAKASPTGDLEISEHKGASSCNSELAHLKALGLSRNVTYSRRCISPVFPENVDRATVSHVHSTLLTDATVIDLEDLCSTDIKDLPCDPLELAVPPPDPKSLGQYGHLLFGIATSSKRLRASKETFAHWLADSSATLICIITDKAKDLPSLDLEALEAEYAASGMKLKLFHKHDPHHSPEQSHMMVIKDMLSYCSMTSTNPDWLGVLDDDTFIPSLHALSTELSRHDHTHSRYLGALTEDANAIRQGVLAAWGGAGIFMSLALAKEIEPHLDGCLGGRPGGDMLIMKCVHAHSSARLTVVEGLRQMDFFGDTAGFYESGRRALSMHHWKSWHWLPVREMAAITWICGDCFLERFVFSPPGTESTEGHQGAMGTPESDGVAVLNVGFSINLYTGDEGLPDLSKTEQTWDGDNAWQNFEWSVGPLRAKVGKDRKKTWWLRTALNGRDGGLTQVYLHEGKAEGKDDEVIELVWQT